MRPFRGTYAAPPMPPPFDLPVTGAGGGAGGLASAAGHAAGAVGADDTFAADAREDERARLLTKSGSCGTGEHRRGGRHQRTGSEPPPGLRGSRHQRSVSEGAEGAAARLGQSAAGPSAASAASAAALKQKQANASLVVEEEEDCCPTCLEEYDAENPRITLECGHHFHLGCIFEWQERSENCPVCGKRMAFELES